MTTDLCHRQLIHSGISTRFSSATSVISDINVIHAPSPFTRLLREFLEVTDALLASSMSHHGVECFIDTTGPPVKTSPRQLTPEKLRIAKQYFDMMTAAGICRCCDSPWSSGLHMVAKKKWDHPPVLRLSPPERTHIRRRLPHPSHPLFRSRPRRMSNLLKKRPSERLSLGPSQREGRPHALRLVWIHPDAVWPE